MSVSDRIRALVEAGGGRVDVTRVVQEALGIAGAKGPLARQLAVAAVAEARGLTVEGDEVVACAVQPRGGQVIALALTPSRSAAALPPLVAVIDVPVEPGAVARVTDLTGPGWREATERLGRELAGTIVLALSAGPARRLLRTATLLAGLDPSEEPVVVALARVARAIGMPLASAEDAAGLVGAAVPESPAAAAPLLGLLAAVLAEKAGTDIADLIDVADRDVASEFDFGERAFTRDHLLALPETPGVYIFEDAEGDVAYVGKGANLRRRVASYFVVKVDERSGRIREAAHALSFERTGTELSALLREQELIEELQPALNVQERVHERQRSAPSGLVRDAPVAIIQPSAEGGAEIVVLDPRRGPAIAIIAPEGDDEEERSALGALLDELRRRPQAQGPVPAVQLALSWLADHGQTASVLDASGESAAVADLACRVARDPALAEGRIVPLR